MKKTILIIWVVLQSIFSYSQENKTEKFVTDSLIKEINKFYYILQENLEGRTIAQKDINKILNHVYLNLPDSFQTANDILPINVTKDVGFKSIKEQFNDLLGKKDCQVKFVSWDGWDGVFSCTGIRIDICHKDYSNQLLSIIGTKGEIYSLFSIKSLVVVK
jgi:hypothetical protein